MDKIIHLHSQATSLVINAFPVPEVIYWGERLTTIDNNMLLATQRAVPQARLDKDIPLSLCPELGRGMFSAPGIEGHREGLDWAPVFSTTHIEYDEHSAQFELFDQIAHLKLNINIKIDFRSNVIDKQMTLTNLSKSDYCLNKLALTLPLPTTMNELMTFHGRWCYEFHNQRVPFTHGGFIQENRRGRTSHENFPGIFVGTQGFSEQHGEVYGFHLGWSGNHLLRADVKSDGRRFVQSGELLLSGEVILKANECYSTPHFYASYSPQGLNQLSQNFHQFVRENLLTFANNKPRPIHLNTWEGIYFDHNPDYIMQMATESAQMGVERFIIDDGWFVGRNDDRRALGDWFLDDKKYPQGLEKIIEHVENLGMEFGLWFEPEMVSKESMLYQQHPEWLLEIAGYQQPTGRWQYLLDLQNADCFNYLFTRLDELLSRYAIRYIKWDMNREMVQPAHFGKAAVHKQTHALYKLFDQLQRKHPDVEFESCSSGGGRIDYEILKRSQRFWNSDCNDALERQIIQRGMSYFFPPEVMGAHIGAFESHSTRRMHHINMRGVTALCGHMGVELDPIKVDEQEKKAFAHYIALHKHYRSLLHHGISFKLDSPPQQMIYGVQDAYETLLVICQLAMSDYALPSPVKFINLKPHTLYQVKVIDAPQASWQLMKQSPHWMEHDVQLTGETLMKIGLAMPLLDPESALIITLTQQETR